MCLSHFCFCAATIAIQHVPRRKAEVVTQVTDLLATPSDLLATASDLLSAAGDLLATPSDLQTTADDLVSTRCVYLCIYMFTHVTQK